MEIPLHRRVLVPRFIGYIKEHHPHPYMLLDVGCGLLDPLFKEHFKDAYLGIDIYGRHDSLADIQYLPFRDGSFDLVTAWSVIEHVKNPYLCVKEMLRVSSHKVILTTDFTAQHKDGDPDHLYSWTPKTFKQFLLLHGYPVEVSITTGIMGVIEKKWSVESKNMNVIAQSVVIRRLVASDRVKILQMLNECGEQTQHLFRPITYFYNLEGVNWLFNTLNDLDARRFVADNGEGKVLGFIYYYAKDNKAFLGIVVADEYQRMGIGNQLVEAVEEDARTRGLSSMYTGGGTLDGGPLQGLLSKRGYIDKGKYTTTHCMMEKKLNPLDMSIGKVEGSGMGKNG